MFGWHPCDSNSRLNLRPRIRFIEYGSYINKKKSFIKYFNQVTFYTSWIKLANCEEINNECFVEKNY